MMIKVLVDSTCDLPEDILRQYDVHVLPLRVILGDQEYIDKKTIQVDNVYDAMRQGILPKTSLPNPQDIYTIFQDYCDKGYDFIYLSFSSVLSGTCQLAQSVWQEFNSK